ncbi:GntR family transcriptional regulator [Lacticaseibacillus thailandensis]|uniref:GntR family transcriptional regulator n=1 Tax=Lacticaseibacillus thailandensis TaxID=381741 RepID=UPI0009EA9AC7
MIFFNLTHASQLINVTRLRYVNGDPFCVEYIYFTPEFASIANQNLNGSLYQVLHDKFGKTPAGGQKKFDIKKADTKEAFLLEVDRGTALMQISDFVYDQNDHPLHISRQVIRSDKYKYVLIQ